MDEAFFPFSEMIDKISAIDGEQHDSANGIHSYITRLEIESPVELDILTDASGKVQIGIVPPLYRVDTSFQPAYHSIRFTAEIFEP